MINFIDETGKQRSAIVECKKTKGVNGEKSLTGTIYTNDEILEGIGRGWRLQFEGENYCLTYVNPIDEGTRIVVEFDAVHEFFFDLQKSVVYQELNGSNTADAYLKLIFNGSGYEYRLEVTIPAFEKESFGMKNRLDLFKDFISSTGVEFSVNGKIVRILEKVGSNLSTIVKKGFNLNELRIEKDAGSFITYLKGFGAWKDEEDHSKGRLEVEYLSPLANVYGKLEGDPIVDERYTKSDSLLTRLKNEVESSYGISVDIDMEDLTKAGYEYDQPHEGDYIIAINKDLGFEQKIRIMSYTTSYDTEENVIDHEVSCGSDNIIKQSAKNDNNFQKEVQAGLENAASKANKAWIAANGKNMVFFGADEPTATNVGDIWYQIDGEETIMNFWNGYEWEPFINPKAVEKAADEAKQAGEEAKQAGEEAKQVGAAAQVSADEAKALGEEAKQAGEDAKTLGNEALEAGQNALDKATTADSNASTALTNANNAVDKATQAAQKADNSTTVANEAKTQATNAVTNANTALTNANKAIQDVGNLGENVESLSALATTAGNNANTALTNARNAINQITQLNSDLEDTNGQVSTLTDNLNGFKQTVYTKTQTDTKIAAVQSDVNGFKTSVSNTYATKSEIQGIKAGVRNYICEVAWTTKGYLETNGSVTNSNDNRASGFIDVDASKPWIFQQFESPTSGNVYVAFYDTNKNLVGSRVTLADGQTGTTASNVTYMRLSTPYKDTFGGRYKFEFGTVKSDWTQAPEDTQFIYTNLQTQVDQTANAISNKADKTTVDQISGRVDTAEGNITTMAGQIKLKANKSTVDTITNRVSATEASLSLQDGKITALTTKTDGLDTSLSSLTQDYNGFKGTVYSKTQTDAKITTVQATIDTFETTVSSTYSTKAETDSKVTAVQANVDKLGTNISYAWSPDGKDRFAGVKPNENLWSIANSILGKFQDWSTGLNLTINPARFTSDFLPVKEGEEYWISSNYASYNFSVFLYKDTSSNAGLRLNDGNKNANSWVTLSSNGGGITSGGFKIPSGYSYMRLSANVTNSDIVTPDLITSRKVKLEKSDKATIYTTNPADDYDNAVPRYIGRSLKDSNDPEDYKYEPNPERKPWTVYAQDVNGKDLSLMPYGEQLLPNSSFANSNNWLGITSVANGVATMTKSSTTSSRQFLQTGILGYSISNLYTSQVEIYIESSNNSLKGSGSSWFLRTFDSSNNTLNVFDYNLDNLELNKWIKLEQVNKPLHSRTDTSKTLQFSIAMGNNFIGTVKIRKPKLEIANTMGITTPYTLAPSEDPLSAIPKYVGTAALPYDDWTKYDWRLSSDWNQVKTSTKFEQTDKAIGLKADQTTVNTITGRVSTAEGKITTMAGQIELKANQTDVDTVKSRVSATESSLQLQDGKITALTSKTDGHTTDIGKLQTSYSGLSSTIAQVQTDLNGKATTTQFSNLSQTVSSLQGTVQDKADKSQITQLSNQITVTVSNLSTSGVNLFSDSRGATNWGVSNATNVIQSQIDESTSPYGKAKKIVMDASSSGGVFKTPSVALISGKQYSWSVYLKANSSGNMNVGSEKGGRKYCAVTTSWQRFTYTFTANDNQNYAFTFYRASGNISELYIHSPVLTEGNIIPNWSESLNDSATQSQITQLSDRMNFRITNSDGSITQIDLANKVISLSGEQVNITGNTYIANGFIKTAAIADLAVNGAKIANLAVSEGKIADLAVTNAKIANLAVDEGKIANLAVTNAKIGNLAVNEGKIADLAVTNAKIANLAVSTAKIADLAVTNAKIGSISADKINVGTLNAANVNIINLNASNITTGTITGANLSIDLSTGVVNFQKGVIQKTDGSFKIDITNGSVESYQTTGGFTLNNGEISLRDSSIFNSNGITYGKIRWQLGSFTAQGMSLRGKEGWELSTMDFSRGIFTRSTGSGIYGSTDLGIYAQDRISLSGGSLTSNNIAPSAPSILIGCNYNNISQVGADINIYGNWVQMTGLQGVIVKGNLSVTGSKNAIHKVANDWIATPAYETAESYLGDIGSNETGESSEVTINIEYLFSQIVNTNMEYQVFLSSYGEGHVWVEKRYPNVFVVKSSKPNTPFAWEIKAKRKGYEHERLVKQVA